MIGQKGIPAAHGGIERHVEELGTRLVGLGHEVTVFTRRAYSQPGLRTYRGMTLRELPTVHSKHLDAVVHSALSSLDTWGGGFDVVHYHAIGPCLTSPLARLRGRKVVATIHGQDWRRSKWSLIAKQVLRLGETLALTVPHATICVSERLTAEYHAAGHARVRFIPNGVATESGQDYSILAELGVEPGCYVFFAGRLVPEKGAHHLLAAWRELGLHGWKLVLAGDSSFTDAYVAGLRDFAQADVVFAGPVYGARLATLFREAALFVLPSELEGLPIVLLEALAYGAPVLASDIAPNVEVLGEDGAYFTSGDVRELATCMAALLPHAADLREESRSRSAMMRARYDWDRVARLTCDVYEEIMQG